MRNELYKICEEASKDKGKIKFFLNCSTLDELYDYFADRAHGLTKDEFDEFIFEILENYEEEQDRTSDVYEGNLLKISGGSGGWKTKSTAAILALMSALPAANVGAMSTYSAYPSSETIAKRAIAGVNNKISGAYKKTKTWVRRHPKLTVGIGALILAIGALLWNRARQTHEDADGLVKDPESGVKVTDANDMSPKGSTPQSEEDLEEQPKNPPVKPQKPNKLIPMVDKGKEGTTNNLEEQQKVPPMRPQKPEPTAPKGGLQNQTNPEAGLKGNGLKSQGDVQVGFILRSEDKDKILTEKQKKSAIDFVNENKEKLKTIFNTIINYKSDGDYNANRFSHRDSIEVLLSTEGRGDIWSVVLNNKSLSEDFRNKARQLRDDMGNIKTHLGTHSLVSAFRTAAKEIAKRLGVSY